jgi:predicted RNase H-like nuclease (RuvC/YqgF family)
MPDDLLYKSARYTNKENERNDDFNRRDEKKFRFMDVNSPKGNIIKAKMLLQQQMNVQKENIGNMNDNGKKEKEKEVRNNRKEQFEDARKRIQNLEEKIDNLRRYYNKTN